MQKKKKKMFGQKRTVVIRFSALGAYVILEAHGKGPIRYRALIRGGGGCP